MFSFNRNAQAIDAPWNARPTLGKVPTQSSVQVSTSHPIAKTTPILSAPVKGTPQPTILPVVSRTLSPIFNRYPIDGGGDYPIRPFPVRILPIARRTEPIPPTPAVKQPPSTGGQGGTGSTSPSPVINPTAAQPPPDPGQTLLNGGGGGSDLGAGAGGIGTSIDIPSPVVVPNMGGNNAGLGLAIVASVVAGGIWYYIEHRKKHEHSSSSNPTA